MAEDVCIFSANAIRAQVILHALQQAGISAVLSANKPMNYKLSIYGTPPPGHPGAVNTNGFTRTVLPGIVIIDAYSYTRAELKAFKEAASDIFARMHAVVLKVPHDNTDFEVQCRSMNSCVPVPIDPDLIVAKVKALMASKDAADARPTPAAKDEDKLLNDLRGFLNLK
ncbi:MAG: hypothetical protein HQL61_16300 [Magnetococcales bacterium]|nr:hypothetical protein [Nitrospirota bacterium]